MRHLDDDLILPPTLDEGTLPWFVFVVQLRERFSAADRDAILATLRAEGVSCSNYFSPIHLQPYIADLLGTATGAFPVTEAIAERTIALPVFTDLDPESQQRVVSTLTQALASRRDGED